MFCASPVLSTKTFFAPWKARPAVETPAAVAILISTGQAGKQETFRQQGPRARRILSAEQWTLRVAYTRGEYNENRALHQQYKNVYSAAQTAVTILKITS